jgi:RNA polymerase primary sigma factor
MEDLIQEGYLGLTRGIRKYNNLNVKLSTYVAWWIKQAITRYIINNSRNIRLPNHIVEKLTKIKKVINGWQLENSEMPSNKDIADELGIDEDEIEKLLSYGKDTISIDEQIKGEEDLKIEDTIADENNLSPENEAERTNALEKIYDSLSCLDENEKEVISLRFGFNDDNDFTLEQIGKVMGISKERVRQIENKALVKLKKRLKGLI